jgi:hypothetical protein
VFPHKHECEQASIMHTFKRTYKHAGDLLYVSKSEFVYIRACIIARVRFDFVHASGVNTANLKPHGSV